MAPLKNKTRHHYIPQYYLKGFCNDSRASHIWVYEKGRKQGFLTSVKNVAVEKDFYTIEGSDGTKDSNTVEDYLMNKIEQPADAILDKIRAKQAIIPEEKHIFSRYICATVKRGPWSREKLMRMVPGHITALREEIDREWPVTHRAAGLKILAQYENKFPKKYFMSFEGEGIIDAINAMTWQFLVAPGERRFLTSDNPVFRFDEIGLRHPFSEITFPVSQKVVLWGSWRSDIREEYLITTNQAVREINRRTAKFAVRYIYHSFNSSQVVALANEDIKRLNRLL